MKSVLLAFLALLLFSVNASAQFVWQKTYGPFSSMNLSRMIPLKNGGYLLFGSHYTGTPSQVVPGYVVRTNSIGDTVWSRKYLPPNAISSFVFDAAEDYDGNLVLVSAWDTGNSNNPNGSIYKLKPNGDTLWIKKMITPQADRYKNIIIAHDSTYLVSAEIGGNNYVQKISKNGTVIWSRSYSFSPTDPGLVSYLHAAPLGYFVFVRSGASTTNYETKVYKINENGVEQYSKKNRISNIYDVATDANQNLLVCGNGRLFKLNPIGDTLWSKVYKRANNYISLRSVKPTPDGNYVALFEWYSNTYLDIGFMKVNANGTLIKDTALYRGGENDYAKDIVLDANGDYVFAGYSGVQNGFVYFMCKYRKWNQLVGIKEDNEIISSVKLYPNPATKQTIVESVKPLTGTYSLHTLQGQKLWQETVLKSTQKVVPLQSLSAGIYILRFVSENGTQFSRKVVKQ